MINIITKYQTRKTALEAKANRTPEEEKVFNALVVLQAQSEKLDQANASDPDGVEEAQEAFDAATKAVEEAEKSA